MKCSSSKFAFNSYFGVTDCKLPLAPARVLSIASRANAKSPHALWPIRASTFRLRQSERHIPTAPIRTHELSSRLSGQRRILGHVGASRLHMQASRNITRKVVAFPTQVFVPIICFWPTCRSLFGIDNGSLHWRACLFLDNLLQCPTTLFPPFLRKSPTPGLRTCKCG